MSRGVFQGNAFDDTGTPIGSATVAVYDSEGALADLWEDRAGTTAKANPFSADAEGFFRFYTWPGRYKIDVSDGSTTRTFQNEIVEAHAYTFFATRAEAQASAISPTISVIETKQYRANFATGRATYIRSSVSERGGFTDAAGALWILARNQRIDLYQFGAYGDGTTNDTDALRDGLLYSMEQGITLYIDKGVYSVSFVDETLTNDVTVECSHDAVIKSIDNLSEFDLDGTTTTFTVTDDWYSEFEGRFGVIQAEIYDPNYVYQDGDTEFAAHEQLSITTDFTVDGNEITLNDASGTNGKILRVSPRDELIGFNGQRLYGVKWTGGVIDCSLRGLLTNQASGSGIGVADLARFSFWRIRFIGGADDYWTAFENGRSDSALQGTGCRYGSITECFFQGWAGTAMYLNGSAPGDPADSEGRGVHIAHNTVIGCLSFAAIRRYLFNCDVHDNYVERCGRGVIIVGGSSSDGGNAVVHDNTFRKLGAWAVYSVFSPGTRAHDNEIIDFGKHNREPSLTMSQPWAIWASGADYQTIHGNTVRFEDWTPTTQIFFRASGGTFEGGSSTARRIALANNIISDVPTAYELATGSSPISVDGDMLEDVTTIVTDSSNRLRWRVFIGSEESQEPVEKWGVGEKEYSGIHEWTPRFVFGATDASQSGTVVDVGKATIDKNGLVTARWRMEAVVTHSETTAQFRVRGLPFDGIAETTDLEAGYGVVYLIANISTDAGTIGIIPAVLEGTDIISFRQLGAGNNLRGDNVTSGSNIILEGQVTYQSNLNFTEQS